MVIRQPQPSFGADERLELKAGAILDVGGEDDGDIETAGH
jgi:hypothetical protein